MTEVTPTDWERNWEYGPLPSGIYEWAAANDLTLEIHDDRERGRWPRYRAGFTDTDVIDDKGFLDRVCGRGETSDRAIAQYAALISDKRIAVNPTTPFRRDIDVPQLYHIYSERQDEERQAMLKVVIGALHCLERRIESLLQENDELSLRNNDMIQARRKEWISLCERIRDLQRMNCTLQTTLREERKVAFAHGDQRPLRP